MEQPAQQPAQAAAAQGADAGVEISLDLPLGSQDDGVDPLALLFGSGGAPPDRAPASASEEDWEDAETGQPVAPPKASRLFV